MKRRFYVIFTLLGILLLGAANSIFASDCSTVHNDKVSQQENIYVMKHGEPSKTRLLIQSIEVWNHGEFLEIICHENLGVITCTLLRSSGSVISLDAFNSDTQPITYIHTPLAQGTYLLDLVSSSGYHGYAVITIIN